MNEWSLGLEGNHERLRFLLPFPPIEIKKSRAEQGRHGGLAPVRYISLPLSYLSIYLSIYLSVCLSVCLSVYLSF